MNDHRIASIVDPTLPLGFLANTVATVAVGIGAAQPIFGNTVLTDAAGRSIHNSADRPVPILQAPPEVIRSLLLKSFRRRVKRASSRFQNLREACMLLLTIKPNFPIATLPLRQLWGLESADPRNGLNH